MVLKIRTTNDQYVFEKVYVSSTNLTIRQIQTNNA